MRLPYLLVLTALTAAPASAAEAGKLLPTETELVVTLNVRQFLDDHKNSDLVRSYLEQWHLALQDDSVLLKKYYRDRNLAKTEGVAEQEFLDRARVFRAVRDFLGVDIFQDVDRITLGFTRGAAGFWVVVLDGRFTGEQHGPLVKLNDNTLTAASDRHWLDIVRATAAGRKQGGLTAATRSLLDRSAKLHVALVVNKVDVLLKDVLTLLKEKTSAGQLSAWLEKYGADAASLSIGLVNGADDLKLQWGVETKKPEAAQELATLLKRGNGFAALALLALNNDLSKQLAAIVLRQRVEVKETTLVVQVPIPHEFIRQVTDTTRQTLHPFMEEVNYRLLSVPIWGPGKPPPGALAVEAVRDIPYRDDAQADRFAHRLDLFVPKGKKDYPVLVLVHGGAWTTGDNRCCGLYSAVGQFLAGQGIGVVLPNYRLSPYVRHPAHVQDVARAVAWTRAHIAEYGGSPQRLFLLGHSAGGHLVSLLATDESYLKAEGLTVADIKGVIAVSGVYNILPGSIDFLIGGSGSKAVRVDQMAPLRGDVPLPTTRFPGMPFRLDVFGPIFGDDPKARAAASPLHHVHRGLPPFLLLSARNDLPTLSPMADEFLEALRRAGCDVQLLRLEKRNHNSEMFSAITPDDPSARAILDFVRRHDKHK